MRLNIGLQLLHSKKMLTSNIVRNTGFSEHFFPRQLVAAHSYLAKNEETFMIFVEYRIKQ